MVISLIKRLWWARERRKFGSFGIHRAWCRKFGCVTELEWTSAVDGERLYRCRHCDNIIAVPSDAAFDTWLESL